MGQKELAALADCSVATIQSIELGRLKLSESLALKISLATGVDLHWLLENNLSAPIYASSEAANLISDSYPLTPLTFELFELVQAERLVEALPLDIRYDQIQDFRYYGRLRAILEAARTKGLRALAAYKVRVFLDEMEREFGANLEVYDDLDVHFDAGFTFAQKELEDSWRLLRVLYDERPPDQISDKERADIELDRATFLEKPPYKKGRILLAARNSFVSVPSHLSKSPSTTHSTPTPDFTVNRSTRKPGSKNLRDELPASQHPTDPIPPSAESPKTSAPPPASPAPGSAGKASSSPRAQVPAMPPSKQSSPTPPSPAESPKTSQPQRAGRSGGKQRK